MAIKPTAEQEAARNVFAEGNELSLIAGAGTGKTTTLAMMGAAAPRKRGLYIAFNRAIANDARENFGPNVKCSTAHGLAFREVGSQYRHRLNSPRIPAKKAASVLGITHNVRIDGRHIPVHHQVRLVMSMVEKFCHTADPQVMSRHMEQLNGLEEPAQEEVARYLLPFAQRAWEDLQRTHGELRFQHDHYLKMWALTKPELPADFILLDEAQDTNAVFEEVFLAQKAQRICVGDPAQQIYAWRGARDIMTDFPAPSLHLTRSFRFGQPIADMANRWLEHAESPMRLTGHGTEPCRIGDLTNPQAVLCRGNADALKEVMSFLEQGTPVALAGGGTPLASIAKAAADLKSGRHTSHRELFLFRTWQEVQDFVEHDQAGRDLRALVQAVDAHGTELILDAVNKLSSEANAQVTVSTAHKAKGREWDSVRIGEGFTAPSVDDMGIQSPMQLGEARLTYVAVTRAKHLLDARMLSWLDAYEKALGGPDQDGYVGGRAMIDLPLTAQLRFSTSPVSEFIEQHLPYSENIVREYLRHIDGLPHPVQPIDVQRPNWSNLGHTVDYRLRLAFGGGLGPAVTSGVNALDGSTPLRGTPGPESLKALHTAGRKLLDTIGCYLAGNRAVDDKELTRLCFVAGYYEDITRTGEIRRHSMLSSATPGTTLEDLTDAVPDYVINDITDQLRLAQGPLSSFRLLPPERRLCGPVFDGSGDIGGADADYILDGLLLDCKATTKPRGLGREEIYQLTGYLLLDYNDIYRINRVGIYLSRQGGLVTWDVNSFLRRLGAGAPLPQLRSAFRHHLQSRRLEMARARPAFFWDDCDVQ